MGLFTSRLSKLYQPKTDSEKFVGQFDWETWKQLTGWSDIDSEDYIPDVISIEQLKTKLKKPNIRFIIFVAEWCGDSRYAAPILIHLFKICGISDERFSLIGVSRDKMSPAIAFRNSIDSIPTLLVFFDDYEIGRIEEYPAVSWEYDLMKILLDF